MPYYSLPPIISSGLALTLFVLWIFTDNHYFSFALDYFALFANFLYRRSDFHLNALLEKLALAYFDRHVILPLVRSYGETSTVTLSPGRIRM